MLTRFALILISVQLVFGQAPLRVFASNGLKTPVLALQAQVEKAAGRPLAIEWGTTAGLKRKIEAGEAFDLAVITTEATTDLVKQGKLTGSTDVARVGIGFGIRAGAPKPDFSTPDAVKQSLLKAKSIGTVKEGASRPTVDKMMEKLGIASAVSSKLKYVGSTEESGEDVAKGEIEIEIIPLTEVPLVNGTAIAGPLPGDLQNYLHFSASVSANSKNADAAKKVIAALTAPAAAPVYKSKGAEMK